MNEQINKYCSVVQSQLNVHRVAFNWSSMNESGLYLASSIFGTFCKPDNRGGLGKEVFSETL